MLQGKNSILGIILLFFFSLPSFAQNASNILEGTVRDIKGKPIELATVSLNNVIGSHTDRNGHYKLTRLKEGTYQYRVSFVGYETVTGTVHIQSLKTRLDVTLKELSLNLKNVTVTARQEQMGSKSLIGEDAIRHVQPKSLNDLLQLVPGNLIENPNLNNLGQAHIREIEDDDNNALGTLVVVDGTPLSNESNLQVVSPSKFGANSGMQSDGMSEQTTAGRGVDLRTVSAGNIESMEVIRGIPSVEYGNLTSGVVVVKTKAGHTPWEAKFQTDPNSKQAFAGKGFNLKRGGAANFSVDWSQSWADTRKHYMGYDRITASAGYSAQFGPLSLNVKGAFYSNVNNRKDDPQFEEQQIHYKNTNVGGRLSVSGRYKPAGGFLSSLDYNLAAQMSRTVDSHDNWVNNPDGLVTTAREPGVHVAQIRNVGYTSAYRIEGIPVNLYAQAVANKYLQISENDYANLKLGAEYTYDANRGEGFTYDENNPPQAQGAQTLRPRSYKDIPAQNTLSGFASSRLRKGLGSMGLMLEAGVRVSNMFVDREQSGGISHFLVAEPRVNATLNLLDSRNNPVFDLLALTGGFGISNKMPTLMYLYPDYAYFDNASLSKYGTETKDRLGLITTDVVKNTANPDLRPARSTKWEAGLSFRINRIKGFATFFHESHRHELGFTSQLIWQNYDKYTVPATATDPVFDAASGDVTYRTDGTEHTALRTKTTEMYTWSRAANGTTTHKHGIEYGLGFGEIKPLHTSLNISGAWFHIKRKNENMPLNYINSSFDYVGVLPSGGGNLRDRFNSTFRLITHIPAIKMVFTTSVQVVWYESTQTIYEDENGNSRYYLKSYEDKDYLVVDPVGYYDKQGRYTAWSPADADDADKSRIMYRTQPYLYEKDVIKPWALLSFRFTKEIGRVAELSVIANNFTNTKKWHTNPHSLAKTQLYPDMYFGAELKLKL